MRESIAIAALADPEVIVVEDASVDATAAIAAEHGAEVVRIDKRQIAAARNAGAVVATGDVLIFIDADTIVNAQAIREAVDAIAAGAEYAGRRSGSMSRARGG